MLRLLLLLALFGLRVNSNHHLATFGFCVMENSQTMHLATLVCMWAGVLPNHASRMLCLHVAREYSPTMHHVAGSAPPKIKKKHSLCACDRGILRNPTLAFLVRMRQGCLPNHTSRGQGARPNRTQCASAATRGLHGHGRQAGPGPPPPPTPPVAPWTMPMDYDDLSTNDNSNHMYACIAIWLPHGCYGC